MEDSNTEMVDAISRYAREELSPHIDEWDAAGGLPEAVIANLAEMGLFGMLSPRDVGGLDLDISTFCRVIEELARHAGAVSTIVHVHSFTPCALLKDVAPNAHRDIQADLAAGRKIGAFCLTEPQAGSDASMVRTTARKDGDGWIINGSKQFISNGAIADVVIVVAITDPDAGKNGLSIFMVPTDAPGFAVTCVERKLGQRLSDTASISFDDYKAPQDALLGELGSAYRTIMGMLSDGRVAIAAQAIGFAQGAFDLACAYAKEREAFGKRIIDHQALAFRLADMNTKIDIARTYVRRVANMIDRGEPCIKEASMAKLFAAQMSESVCSDAIQVFGGYGYVEDTGVARFYRDTRVCQIYEGTNDMQRLVIARSLGHDDRR